MAEWKPITIAANAAGFDTRGTRMAVELESNGNRLSGFAFLGGRFDGFCLGYARL